MGLQRLLGHVPDQSLPDLLSSIVKGSFEEKLKVLDAVQLVQKLKAAQPLVTRQIEVGTVCIFHSDHSLSVHGKGLCVVCWSCDHHMIVLDDCYIIIMYKWSCGCHKM